ncbi:UDP-N-acetylmuramoylalanine--D-glutamate ligase [Opitutia bacterium]|jgi:UDP-N-acetylmuramoylalanine--D-glutamate ligase|nr:UDP-N-acetylmuramoylalanine--D-glutamate ligase [Opitutae bacterium]
MSDFPESLKRRLARPAAILGAGVSGRAVADTLGAAGFASVVYDAQGGNAAFGPDEAARHDLVVYSPGFAQSHPWLLAARRAGRQCLAELDFGALLWSGPAIAITGTNGKTTLTEFLSFAHKRAGQDAIACGNVGLPFTALHATVSNGAFLAVVEVSSFQAEDLRHFSPEAVLWTNFDEDHLDRHGELESYFRAKFRLIERLPPGGVLVVGESVVEHARRFGIDLPAEALVATRAEVADSVPAGSIFEAWPQRENWALAARYWQAKGLPMRSLEESARLFRAAPHRLRKVAEAQGVEYWNDSKGTNFHAVYAALEQFAIPVRWIGGGKWKGGDLRRFAERLAPRIEAAYLIGETGPELQRHLAELGRPARCFAGLQDAVVAAGKDAHGPTAILLSPGFSSFDQFHGYAERGTVFERAALALANRA